MRFTGTIEDILILDRALTADEVTAWSASTQPYYIDNGSSLDAQGNYDIGSFSLPSGYSGLNSLYWDTLAGNITLGDANEDGSRRLCQPRCVR